MARYKQKILSVAAAAIFGAAMVSAQAEASDPKPGSSSGTPPAYTAGCTAVMVACEGGKQAVYGGLDGNGCPTYRCGQDCPNQAAVECPNGKTKVYGQNGNGCPVWSCVPASATATATATVTATVTATGTVIATSTATSPGTATVTSSSTSTSTSGLGASPRGGGQGGFFCQAAALSAMTSLLNLEEGRGQEGKANFDQLNTLVGRAVKLNNPCVPSEVAAGFPEGSEVSELEGKLEAGLGMKRNDVLAYIHEMAKSRKGKGAALGGGIASLIARVPEEAKREKLENELGKPSDEKAEAESKQASYEILPEGGSIREPAPSPAVPSALSVVIATAAKRKGIDIKLGATEEEDAEIRQLKILMMNVDRGKSAPLILGDPERSLFELVRRCYKKFSEQYLKKKP